ncbi:hypothetical protein FBU30_008255 [Linnemannia zychae]|nr:hypothetical protein FBU30_008255 [Linnemannia zychae]
MSESPNTVIRVGIRSSPTPPPDHDTTLVNPTTGMTLEEVVKEVHQLEQVEVQVKADVTVLYLDQRRKRRNNLLKREQRLRQAVVRASDPFLKIMEEMQWDQRKMHENYMQMLERQRQDQQKRNKDYMKLLKRYNQDQ